MSIQVLADKHDETATIYQSSTDWSLGPVFHAHGKVTSATQLAEKFIEWAGLRGRGILDSWNEMWLEGKRNEFNALDWKDCPGCAQEIVPAKEGICIECRETCDECGERDPETKPTSRAIAHQVTARLCPECAKRYSNKEVGHV